MKSCKYAEYGSFEQLLFLLPLLLFLLSSSLLLSLPFQGFPTRMVYLYYYIMLEIHHSDWEPSIFVVIATVITITPLHSPSSNYKCNYIFQRVHPPWLRMLSSPAVWAIVAAHFAENWGFYTLLTQLPSFLKHALDIDLTEVSVCVCVLLGERGGRRERVSVWAIVAAHFAENWGFYTLLTQLPSFLKHALDIDLTEVSVCVCVGGGGWMRWKRGGWLLYSADTAVQLSETRFGYRPHRGKCVLGEGGGWGVGTEGRGLGEGKGDGGASIPC